MITQDAVLSAFSSILSALTLALAGIASVSLAVAGIGIMNVMLVSVTERRAEIGLLKALGAADRQILAAFLAEAVLLAASAGSRGSGSAPVPCACSSSSTRASRPRRPRGRSPQRSRCRLRSAWGSASGRLAARRGSTRSQRSRGGDRGDLELVRFVLGALTGHRLRSVLSALGVAIGVAAVMLLTSLGEGTRQYIVGSSPSSAPT